MTPNTQAANRFGDFLKMRRTHRNMTQAEVAEALDTHGSTISLVENGKKVLKEEQIADWAKAYHMKPKTLRQIWNEALELLPPVEGNSLKHSEDGVSLAFNQLIVKCQNEYCKHHGQSRLVSFPIVGGGLFSMGNVVCECRWMPSIEETPKR